MKTGNPASKINAFKPGLQSNRVISGPVSYTVIDNPGDSHRAETDDKRQGENSTQP